MKTERVLFKSEERKPVNDIADFLRSLAGKIETGKVTLRQPGKEVTLQFPPDAVLEVKVEEETKRDRIKRSLEVELEWMENEEGALIGGGVTIS